MAGHLRWGILGAAKIARTDLMPAMQLARGAELVALATRDAAKAAPFQAVVPGLRLHASYDALLADPQVDAVYIPLPNDLHVEWSLKALAAGKHVLCEKPMALAAGDFDRLIAARAASGLVCAEAFMVCHHPQWQRVRDLIAGGAIGWLQHVEAVFTYNNPDPANIRNNPAHGGGGVLDVGVYPSITARLVTGEEPVAIRSDLRREGGVDVFARVWADFPGFTMSFYCGMRQHRHQFMQFHGTEGIIDLPFPYNAGVAGEALVRVMSGAGNWSVERFEPINQYVLMIEAFGRSVREGAPFACPLEFSRGNQVMVDAILAGGLTQA